MCCGDMRVMGLERSDGKPRLKWRKGIIGEKSLSRASMETTDIKPLMYDIHCLKKCASEEWR